MSITSITSNISARIAAGVVGVALVLSIGFGVAVNSANAAALSETQIQAIISLLQSFGADSTTVSNVSASLRGQATSGTGSTTTGGSCSATFTRNLQVGSTGADVMALQKFLNANGAQVAASGAGSPGSETSSFGPATKAAVMKFQTANGISPVSGYVGPLSRAKMNSMCGGSTTTGGTTTPAPSAGTGLMVSSAAQPANGLAPAGTSRIPFTNFTVTAGNDGDVTISGVTVERTGAAVDSNFSGVVLIDQATGLQVGISKTLNSNHQATIGDTIIIPRGTSKTFTVAANRSAAGTHGGEVASFAVVSVNTTAAVTGSLPITGASHTINETLTVGSVSTSTSAFDPGAAQTKAIGDTGVKFSGLRFTAGSGEDLKLFSVRFRQVGSVSSSDLANVMINANGVDYPTTVDSTGKYYTATFPGGILIAKGNSIDAYIKGDIIGSNAAARTADFDIDKVTDVYFVGQLYGYGIAPSGTYTPWYNGYVFTINAGTATTIGKATEVPAQNVAVNLANQPLGGFVADFKGEAVSVSQMIFNFNYSSLDATNNLLTNVSLVDENGTVVAGPVDAVDVAGVDQKVTFTDSVTFKTGRHIYTLKGKLPSSVTNNQTITASTTPSSWTSPVGQTSGNTISLAGQGVFTMNAMTVKTVALSVTMSSSPASQNIVAGGQGVTFANVQLDASQSGEDVRISSLPIELTTVTVAVSDLSSCQLFNGSTPINTGSNVPSSLAASGSTNTFTFDNSLTVAKGTVTTLTLKCNVSSGATSGGTFIWSINSGDTYTATGVTSGQSATVAATTANSGTMTVGTATLTVATDSSSPAYSLATAGSSGVVLGVYKYHAANEAVTLNRVGFSLGSVTASSTAADFDQTTSLTLWANGVQIGSATITGANRNATSTLSTPVTVPKDGDLVVTIKSNLAAQGSSEASHPGALLTVDADVNGATGNKNTQGTGASSGTTVGATGSTAVSGVRVFKTVPTVATLSSSGTTGSTLIAQSGIELYRFSISANAAGPLAINKMVINIATSSASSANGTTSVTNLKVYAYTDSAFSSGAAGFTDGQIVATVAGLVSNGNNNAILSSILTIPSGSTYYFKVTGDVAQVAGSTGSAGTVTTKLVGDSSYPSLSTLMGQYATGLGNFVWSPLSTTTTAATTNLDWTNGFTVSGLPSAGTNSWTLTK